MENYAPLDSCCAVENGFKSFRLDLPGAGLGKVASWRGRGRRELNVVRILHVHILLPEPQLPAVPDCVTGP